jgi:hypothetical protein
LNMMPNEIRSLASDKYCRIKFWLQKIIWNVILNVMTKEIAWLRREKYSRIKF